MGWQWHELDHMQIICILVQTETTPAPLHSAFNRPDAFPDAQPTVSKHLMQCLKIAEEQQNQKIREHGGLSAAWKWFV